MLHFLTILLSLFIIVACTPQQSTEHKIQTTTMLGTGEGLAHTYCTGCHTFPKPDLLDKGTWNGVLSEMGAKLNVKLNPEDTAAGLDVADWEKIKAFYMENAPQKPLPQVSKEKPESQLANFEVVFPKRRTFGISPLITFVKYNPFDSLIYVTDRRGALFLMDAQLQIKDSIRNRNAVSDMVFNPNHTFEALTIGNINPNDELRGGLYLIEPKKDSKQIFGQLPRPVQVTKTDLNQDNKDDYLICGYGHTTQGKLFWTDVSGDFPVEHLLKSVPGAIKTIVKDLNGDNLLDILALFAQSNEQIVLFENKGKGIFEEKTLLTFPPVYGSNSMDLADVNQDGFMDIIYTNGDNADFSFSLKHFHGVRIFLNDGKNQYTEKWFYPMYGASKVLALDFDNDKDVDLAVIAFFPDFNDKNPQSFIYFENIGDLSFKPFTFGQQHIGRWLVMDAADFDGDGDEDIVLGSYTASLTPVPPEMNEKWQQSGVHLLLLRNKKY